MRFILASLLVSPALVVGAASSASTFGNPAEGVKWRYWLEDAGVSPSAVREDVAEMARVGASGFELLTFESYGLRPVLDPTDVGFGSDALTNITALYVEAARDNGITIDLTLGPDQGAGIPVPPDEVDTPGMNTELVFGTRFLSPGQSFSGPLPDPNIIPIVTYDGIATPGNVTQKALVAVITAQVLSGSNTNASRVSLDWNTVRDVTSSVKTSGNTSTLSIPSPSSNGTSVLLAFYSRRNGYPEAQPGFNGPQPGKPGSWGSYVVDHFSALGAQRSFDFISKNILDRDDISTLLSDPAVGRYGWEDSMEFRSQLYWTDAFPMRFEQRHGYNVSKVLPAFFANPRPPFSGANLPKQTFDFGNTVQWQKFVEDYTDTLTSLYIDYEAEWNTLLSSQGLNFSNQPAYNFPMDVSSSAVVPLVPEIESLGMPTVDNARQVVGGVHLSGHNIFSSETGARRNEAHALRMKELLEDCKLEFASGVNQLMLHGYPYSENYPNTTWPGITTFFYQFAEMHGPTQPGWAHYPQYMKFLARNKHVLQSGSVRIDLAIYRDDYDRVFPDVFRSTSLVSAGYTYDYVSPEALRIVNPAVQSGKLGLPEYKAILLNRQQNITVEAAQRLARYAMAGLPIVVLGDAPSDVHGFDPTGTKQSQVQSIMAALLKLRNVKQVGQESDVPSALASLGAKPAVSFNPPSSQLFTVRRVNGSVEHFFVFNFGSSSVATTMTVDNSVSGTPFVLDAWTGSVAPAAVWSTSASGTVVPGINLAANQTTIISMTTAATFEGSQPQSAHLTSLNSPNATAIALSTTSVELRSTVEGPITVTDSRNRTSSANVTLLGTSAQVLGPWNLTISKYTPPANLFNVRSVIVNQSVPLPNGLQAWNQLSGQQNSSGIGTYTTSFSWTHAGDGRIGALLDFGDIFHTIRAWVNGKETQPIDVTKPVVDVTALLSNGTNAVRVEAASTLLNVVNSVPPNLLLSLGHDRLDSFREKGTQIPANQAYGLTVPVRLVPVGRTTVTLA